MDQAKHKEAVIAGVASACRQQQLPVAVTDEILVGVGSILEARDLGDPVASGERQDVGEHSGANSPWANGIAMAQEYAGEREKFKVRISRLEEALHQALVHWGALGVTPEDGAAYVECEKRLEETLESTCVE